MGNKNAMAKTPAKSKTKTAAKAKPAAKTAAKSASKAAGKAKPAAKKPAVAKKAAGKTPAAKPAPARKAAAKPAPAKKTAAKAPARKAAPAKPAAKPAPAKKAAARPAPAAPAKAAKPAKPAKPGRTAPVKLAQARPAAAEPTRPSTRPAGAARPAVVATARVGRAGTPSDELPTPARKREVAAGPVKLPAGYRPLASEEYMSPRQIEYFRQKLLTWRADLIEESKQTIDNLRDEVRDVGDEAERAARETENSLELRTRDRYRKLLAQIDKALKRIEDGEYGYCEETGEPIGIERLEVRPIARFSIDAQERWELRQKHMGE
mgnify:CR=1 FL=1